MVTTMNDILVNTSKDLINDHISRQAAINDAIAAVDDWDGSTSIGRQKRIEKYINVLPPAQTGQQNARVFQGIIVEYPSISAYPEYEGKPYFSIKYTVNGQKFIGYGTYKPEVLSEYLKEYFMPPAQPEEDIRAMCGECDAWNQYKNYSPPGCEDAVPRTSVEYICKKNTVSTNPYEHKYHDKFIQFMDDPEISDFGRWQHSNGFNTALVAVKCDLDKIPSRPYKEEQP